jgi:hypothetical protein
LVLYLLHITDAGETVVCVTTDAYARNDTKLPVLSVKLTGGKLEPATPAAAFNARGWKTTAACIIVASGLADLTVDVPFAVSETSNYTIYIDGSAATSVDTLTASSTDPQWQSRTTFGALSVLQRRWYYTTPWYNTPNQFIQVDQCSPHKVEQAGWGLVFTSLPLLGL